MAWTIALRELRSMFLSPLAWAVLAVVQGILAYVFLIGIDNFVVFQSRLLGMKDAPGVTDIVIEPMLGTAAVILLLVTPLLTSRLLAEEQRTRTQALLFSAPVSMTEIVLGKYLGMLLFLIVLIGMLAAMPFALLVGGSLDPGKIASGLLGLTLLAASFAAAGLFLSSLTEQPAVAAVSTFGLLLLLWIIDWASGTREEMSAVLGYVSLLRHYESFLKGVFDSTDLAYFLLFSAGFLIFTLRRLDSRRLQP